MFLLTLLVAGNETTRTLLSGTAVVLHEHPDQRAAAGGRRGAGPGGVEECLRWVTPVQRSAGPRPRTRGRRNPSRRVTICACSTRRPTVTSAIFGEDAARFDVRRAANPMHLAFGFGEHVCLGASLARMEAGSSSRSCWPLPGLRGDGPGRAGPLDHGGRDPLAARGAGSRGLSARPGSPAARPGAGRRAATRPPPASALSRSRPPSRSRAHQAVLPQHLDVHAHRGLGQPEEHRQLAHRARCGGQGVQDAPAGRVGHRLEAPGHRFGPAPGPRHRPGPRRRR